MSKNFELMRQAASERQFQSAPPQAEVPPLVAGNGGHFGNGNGYGKSNGLDLDRFAREETLKLVQRVFLLQSSAVPKVVMFAGVDPGNGCSRICAQTAEVLAANVTGTVCVVEANVRTPSLPEYFGVTNHRGLTDSLLQDGPVRSFAKQVRRENLWLLSCGALAADSANLLRTEKLNSRLNELRQQFDFIVVDVPALNQYADAAAVAKVCDGIIIVLEANSTRREAARKMTENLQMTNTPILGVVLNKRTFPVPESLYRRL
jgi:polysaccharide biosynthesis transport protein